ncbi:MAG: hypothetical protein QM652_12190 [Legionella sp.]|uniref:hypothetical protein n=1 Tax=Legionella sp. TaxID=459 RepID=UPI0039E667E3
MPNNSVTKLTDQKLRSFYVNTLGHYDDCRKRGLDDNATFNEMIINVQHSLEAYGGTLYSLSPEEKCQIYTVFYAMWNAFSLTPEQKKDPRQIPEFNETKIHTVNIYHYRDTTLYDWLFLNTILNDCHHHHIPSGDTNSDKDLTQLLAVLALIALAAIAAVIAMIALYYMLSHFAEGIDRFYYNEGWLKAALIMATSIGFGMGTASISAALLSPVLVSLAIMAGFNPVTIVATGVILLSIIGAGIGGFVMDMGYRGIERHVNRDAIDPEDPKRFRLTAENEAVLTHKGINPLLVRLVLVEIRMEIARISNSNGTIPTVLSRFFSCKSEINELLDKVRKLRSGELSNMKQVKVGNRCYDCTMPDCVPQYVEQPYTHIFKPMPTPSAPPIAQMNSQNESSPSYRSPTFGSSFDIGVD